MNPLIFNKIIAKESDKIAAIPEVSPAAAAQLQKSERQRQMNKMVDKSQPARANFNRLRSSQGKPLI